MKTYSEASVRGLLGALEFYADGRDKGIISGVEHIDGKDQFIGVRAGRALKEFRHSEAEAPDINTDFTKALLEAAIKGKSAIHVRHLPPGAQTNVTPEEIEAAALIEGNSGKKYESAPRDIVNPGIYFGFKAGANFILEKLGLNGK